MTRQQRDFGIKSTLAPAGGSILDELTAPDTRPTQPPPAAPAPVVPAPPPAGRKSTPIRVNVPPDLADRVRAAVAALQYRVPEWESLNTAATAALERLVSDAEREHNRGEPFPWRQGGHLRPGRRVGQQ